MYRGETKWAINTEGTQTRAEVDLMVTASNLDTMINKNTEMKAMSMSTRREEAIKGNLKLPSTKNKCMRKQIVRQTSSNGFSHRFNTRRKRISNKSLWSRQLLVNPKGRSSLCRRRQPRLAWNRLRIILQRT